MAVWSSNSEATDELRKNSTDRLVMSVLGRALILEASMLTLLIDNEKVAQSTL